MGNGKKKLHIKKGDQVVVIAGASKGTQAEVKAVYYKTDKVLVDGVNIISRHTKPDSKNPDGGIIKKEAPIHMSNVMLLDPKSGDRTRYGRKEENGKSVRYSKKSGEVIK